MTLVKLSDDPVIRNIQYARVCKKYGCMPTIFSSDGFYLDVPDELYNDVLKTVSYRPKVIIQVRFPAQLLTVETFKQRLGIEPVHLFYSPEGIFTIAFDNDVNMQELLNLLKAIFVPSIEVK